VIDIVKIMPEFVVLPPVHIPISLFLMLFDFKVSAAYLRISDFKFKMLYFKGFLLK